MTVERVAWHPPTKFWQNVAFWVGSLVFSFLPLFLAVAPEAFPFGGLSIAYLGDQKYQDVLTIVFVFVCIAFFDLLDVALTLDHRQTARVILVVTAVMLLLASFAMVVVSHTHEAVAKLKYDVVNVVPNAGAVERGVAGSHEQALSWGAAPPGDPVTKFTPEHPKREPKGPGKLPMGVVFGMFVIAGLCRMAQAAFDTPRTDGRSD